MSITIDHLKKIEATLARIEQHLQDRRPVQDSTADAPLVPKTNGKHLPPRPYRQQSPDDKSGCRIAQEIILAELRKQPGQLVSVDTILESCAARGVSKDVVWRARALLGVRTKRRGWRGHESFIYADDNTRKRPR